MTSVLLDQVPGASLPDRAVANSLSISRLKAGMSPGCRLVTSVPSTTTSRSTQVAPGSFGQPP